MTEDALPIAMTELRVRPGVRSAVTETDCTEFSSLVVRPDDDRTLIRVAQSAVLGDLMGVVETHEVS